MGGFINADLGESGTFRLRPLASSFFGITYFRFRYFFEPFKMRKGVVYMVHF